MRLANVKTRNELGLDYVFHSINLGTPFGAKILKELQPFKPGEEDLLRQEFSKIDKFLKLANERPKSIELLLEAFMSIKDTTFTIERSKNNALSIVELFEIKSLLLLMLQIRKIMEEVSEYIPQAFQLEDITETLNTLDPRMDRINTFYIYDEFSQKLKAYRKEKREAELSIRKCQRVVKSEIEKKYGILLTPKFDYTVSKSNAHLLDTVKSLPEMMVREQDYMSVTFELKPTEEVYGMMKKMESIQVILEEEELQIRENLSKEIALHAEVLLKNCKKIGEMDFTLAKAIYAKQHRCTQPEIVKEHTIEILNGRHLKVEDILQEKGKSYCPISIHLSDGVICITGANMGGKTVSLKLVGLVAILAQYGFFVPCEEGKVGLSNYMHLLIGDSQSVERGLSSFGSEMEELREMLDHSKDRTLLLIDEIASGTNPMEGLALTKGVTTYLKKRAYISLITTHFDSVTMDPDIKNMQVIGLADVDFVKLEREIKYANRKERILIISKYMDYRLEVVNTQSQIPKDALNIAKMLGVYDEIIYTARKELHL